MFDISFKYGVWFLENWELCINHFLLSYRNDLSNGHFSKSYTDMKQAADVTMGPITVDQQETSLRTLGLLVIGNWDWRIGKKILKLGNFIGLLLTGLYDVINLRHQDYYGNNRYGKNIVVYRLMEEFIRKTCFSLIA